MSHWSLSSLGASKYPVTPTGREGTAGGEGAAKEGVGACAPNLLFSMLMSLRIGEDDQHVPFCPGVLDETETVRLCTSQ